MRILRKNFLKNIFGLLVLGLLTAKFLSFSISIFCTSDQAYAIEKSNEDNKEKEEEPFDQFKKKLLIYESSIIVSLNPLLPCSPAINKYAYWLSFDNFPVKNVPTPPPDFLLS